MTRRRPHALLVVTAGLAGSLTLVMLWHLLGLASAPPQVGYENTQYALTRFLTSCSGLPFTLAFALLSAALAWTFPKPWPVALGMVSPLPIALLIEVARNPTSHNLFLFEVVFFWCPALLLSVGAAFLGRQARNRYRPVLATASSPGNASLGEAAVEVRPPSAVLGQISVKAIVVGILVFWALSLFEMYLPLLARLGGILVASASGYPSYW